MGDFTIRQELQEAFKKMNVEWYPIKAATPQEFYSAIKEAKTSNPHGAFVTQHSVEEYSEMKLFITLDGKAGIAITSDSNIVSIFNGGEKRGLLRTLLPLAIDHGGRKLDNFSSKKLTAMYQMYGFNPISKTKFNSMFAPDDWNYERDGEPDIVFWIHNGDSAEDVVLNFGRYRVPWDDVQEFSTYEEAGEYRDNIINDIDDFENE